MKIKSADQQEAQNRLISSRLEEALKSVREAFAKSIGEAEAEITEEKKRCQENENKRFEQSKKDLAAEKDKMERDFDSRLPEFAKTLADRLVSKDC